MHSIANYSRTTDGKNVNYLRTYYWRKEFWLSHHDFTFLHAQWTVPCKSFFDLVTERIFMPLSCISTHTYLAAWLRWMHASRAKIMWCSHWPGTNPPRRVLSQIPNQPWVLRFFPPFLSVNSLTWVVNLWSITSSPPLRGTISSTQPRIDGWWGSMLLSWLKWDVHQNEATRTLSIAQKHHRQAGSKIIRHTGTQKCPFILTKFLRIYKYNHMHQLSSTKLPSLLSL